MRSDKPQKVVFRLPGRKMGFHLYRDGALHSTFTREDGVVMVRKINRGTAIWQAATDYARKAFNFPGDDDNVLPF